MWWRREKGEGLERRAFRLPLIDFEPIVEAAAIAVKRLPVVEEELAHSQKDVLKILAERSELTRINEAARIHRAEADARIAKLNEDVSRLGREVEAANWRADRAKARADGLSATNKTLEAEVALLRAAYENLAGAVAVMNVEALKILETFPEEQADGGPEA